MDAVLKIYRGNALTFRVTHPDYLTEGTVLDSGLGFSITMYDSSYVEVSGTWPVVMSEGPTGVYTATIADTVTDGLTAGSAYWVNTLESTNDQTANFQSVAMERTGNDPSQKALAKIVELAGMGWDSAIP